MSKQKKESTLIRFFKTLGPGLITGASDDDPSGIVTYSQAGAQFGLATLWTALITFPFNTEFLSILVALLGTTISPYLFFWQAPMETEAKHKYSLIINKKVINETNADVDFGMLFQM
ncbi:hypothetical protein BH10PSE19_BH10PSE19_13170 [soil metagenome]